ncbi:pentapeptide repeat-containing protein [Nocardiopsis suaedae]|uniref:Pentapeptide repeat-containing protein n=1 Tax=Nocardiopsis suaedae TaxID=3018444 RepID=A0ABT4THC6_9ACTN|nr:pentapeptide repeat-containing protein [Nocardiopsis suaedae]MDA2804060.1 pentapeptide repeat-containing protein [Nocardiopsis suaedae]
MKFPSPRQKTAIALAAVALPTLTIAAWPIGPILWGALPDGFPAVRLLLGAAAFAALLTAVALFRGAGLWWLITAAWAGAIALVATLGFAAWLVLGSPGLEEVPRLSPKALDAIATRAFAVVAGLGGVALLVIAYRRQRTTERGELRETTRLFAERFTAASEQLGSERPAVRLAGVHALAHLADGAPSDHEVQMVIDVLCAYLRMPYQPAATDLPEDVPPEEREKHREKNRAQRLDFDAMREVRHTIIRIIGNHLREDTRWRGKDYDFTGVAFDGGDLRRAMFPGGSVSFRGAQFCGGLVSFGNTRFSGGPVSFGGARFSGGQVSFSNADFRGGKVSFGHVDFSGGGVSFGSVDFSGGEVSFGGAEFSGSLVYFGDARFSGSLVSFNNVEFSGGEVYFGGSRFTEGTVNFVLARGTAPTELLAAADEGEPGVVDLPASWIHREEPDVHVTSEHDT